MTTWDDIVEQRIREAMDRGEFEHLPGEGKPLELDDDQLIPEDLRVAYRILKNAGFVPEEIDLRREIRDLQVMLDRTEDETERRQALAKLSLLTARLSAGGRKVNLRVESCYFEKIVQRLSGHRG